MREKSSLKYSFEEAWLHIFMRQVDNFSEAFFKDVREIKALDNLIRSTFMRDVKQIESPLATIHDRHFVVTPLVIVVLVESVDPLVFHV